jgi:hypothetical protein
MAYKNIKKRIFKKGYGWMRFIFYNCF